MHKRSDSRGFSHVLPLLVLAVVIGVAFLAYARVRSSTDTALSQVPGCAVTDGIEVCLSADKTDVAYNDTAKLAVTIKNTSWKKFTYVDFTGECGGSQDFLYLNNDKIMADLLDTGFCPDVVGYTISGSPTALWPGETITLDLGIIYGDELTPGSNNRVSVGVMHDERPSGELILTGHKQTAQEIADAERCLAGEIKTYCLLLGVRLDEQYYNDDSTCEEVGRYFGQLRLSPSKCDDLPVGALYFSIPVSQAEAWESRLDALDEVFVVFQPTRSDEKLRGRYPRTE